MRKPFDLSGKTALITGGGTGIGRAIALEFARNGCNVIINYHNSRAEALQTVEEIQALGGTAVAIQADVTEEDQVKHLIEQALTFGGGNLHIVVNNAGTLVERRPIAEMDAALWRRIMDVNMTSTFFVSKHVIEVMKRQQYGRIVNMTSVAARLGGGAGGVAYGTSKGAVLTFTKGLAKELAAFGITVNAIAPGVIATRFHDQYTPAAMRQTQAAKIPLEREGRPDEVAGAAMLLVTSYGDYITGETIEVNGGLLMD